MNTRPLLRTALALVVAISIPCRPRARTERRRRAASRLRARRLAAPERVGRVDARDARRAPGGGRRDPIGRRAGHGAPRERGDSSSSRRDTSSSAARSTSSSGATGRRQGLRVELRAGEVLAKMPRRGGGRATLIGNGEALVAVGRGGVVRARRRPPPAGGKASLAAALDQGRRRCDGGRVDTDEAGHDPRARGRTARRSREPAPDRAVLDQRRPRCSARRGHGWGAGAAGRELQRGRIGDGLFPPRSRAPRPATSSRASAIPLVAA